MKKIDTKSRRAKLEKEKNWTLFFLVVFIIVALIGGSILHDWGVVAISIFLEYHLVLKYERVKESLNSLDMLEK